jgi:hypothetical protein
MGRKQKLRQEKRNIKTNAAAALAAATEYGFADTTRDTTAAEMAEEILKEEKIEAIESQFPKSDEYIQATADTNNINGIEQLGLFENGARI